MRSITLHTVLMGISCTVATSVTFADTLIYNNSNYGGYFTAGYNNYEVFDFGTSPGGLVKKFSFGYRNPSSATSWVRITFYQSLQLKYYEPGYAVKSIFIQNIPPSSNSYRVYEHVLAEGDRFELPNGTFGYTVAVSSSATNLALASGGAGQENELWEYISGWGWNPFWFGGSPWAGLYMKIYTGPPINEVTCDISGYTFNDSNGNGVWNTGEPDIPDWEVYVDTNNNNQYDPGVDPNVVTDPNGMYFFENLASPATYTIREVMPNGWTQTLPGSAAGYEYVVATDPNHAYGPYNFGNTEQVIPTNIKLYGYIRTEEGDPISDARVQTRVGSTSFGFDDTDEQGYYEIVVSAPFTGSVNVTKAGWQQNTISAGHTNLVTDYRQDFKMLFVYGGGDGSEADPYQIQTAEQLLMIDRQPIHFDDHFVLTSDIDLAGITYSEPIIASFDQGIFSGTFDGAGFSVLNLYSHSGLFGDIRNAVIKNLGVEDVEITGGGSVGALCHSNHGGTIENCFTTGNVSALFDAGGLCAWAHKKYLRDAPHGSSIPINTPVIKNCYSKVNVTLHLSPNLFSDIPFGYAGGLCGYAESAELTNNYACGTVDASGGYSVFGTLGITNSGGLVGHLEDCNVTNNYSTTHLVDQEYNNPGGFCAVVSGGIAVGNYWDVQTSDQSTSACGTGLPTAQMQMMASYAGWDFVDIWRICDGMNTPRLQWEPVAVGDFGCPEGVGLYDLLTLSDAWLTTVASVADIAPEGVPDGKVNLLDYTLFAENWLVGAD